MPRRLPVSEHRRNTIGWKVTDAKYAELIPFFETFPDYPMSSAMEWLLEQPAVLACIEERVASISVPA